MGITCRGNRMRRLLIALALLGSWAAAAEIPSQAVLTNETALAYSNTYYLDLSQVKSVSMQVNWASATVAAQTFTDGEQSTGTFTVASFLALSTATATAKVLITSNTALANQTLFIAGSNIPIRVDLLTSSNTACNIASDIASQTVYLSTCAFGSATGVVFSTAPAYGSYWNKFSIQSSSLTAISSAAFSGGQDAATACINGTCVLAGKDFIPITSTAQTATNLAAAFNASVASLTVTSQAVGSVVTSTTNSVGLNTSYTITTTSQSALTIGPFTSSSTALGNATGSMFGAMDSSFAINVGTITIAAHKFTKALPVLYTAGTLAISGLTNQTTYYVVPVTAGTFMLATTSAKAQLGQADVVPTSSGTQTAAHTYTLAPLAITGTPTFRWEASNDQTNWAPLTTTVYNVAIASITMSVFSSTGTVSIWDLGPVSYNWLRLNVQGPTTGGVQLKTFVAGKP